MKIQDTAIANFHALQYHVHDLLTYCFKRRLRLAHAPLNALAVQFRRNHLRVQLVHELVNNGRLPFVDDEVPLIVLVIAVEMVCIQVHHPLLELGAYPHLQFSEMKRLSSCASELMMVKSSSPPRMRL